MLPGRTSASTPKTAYQIAYEAMLKGSLALMLAHGQRPRVQLGHHIAIIEFAQKNLDPALAPTFALFDRMRRKIRSRSRGIHRGSEHRP